MKYLRLAVAALAAGLASTGAIAQEKFTYLTNWYAQAEHGGFYHGLASGSYKAAGLDVTIRMGGPQVNGMQLLAAGQADCFMGYDTQTMRTREQGINAVTVAATAGRAPATTTRLQSTATDDRRRTARIQPILQVLQATGMEVVRAR